MASRRSVLVKSLCFFLYTTNLVLLAFSKRKCSWENCFEWNKDESIIKVHILSHTHDDMGWIKTVDEYYTGENPFNSPASVQYIFNNVISELLNDPNRKFVYAETGFLQLYLEDHGPKELEKLRKLITETGQLELIGGGWVQPDEAASHYIELIDQYTLGLRILNDTFGECAVPIVGWQIDPFGHSREHASLLSQMGYNSLYFSRQHHLELDARKLNKSLEFEWNTSDDLGTRIFTGTFSRGTYAPPEQFCFDVLCIHEPIVDNPRLQGYNILQMANNFTSVVREQVSHFKHNHALITMGGDFQYSNANTWFTNLERLMKYINANSSKYKMQLFYSTMSCYTRAILETGTEWPTRSGDFFPYATLPQGYWTGYFTSKPNLKHIIRESSALLQLMREMNVFAKRPKYSVAEEEILERAVSLSMHHDAVTGTSKEYVSADYERRLFNARDVAETAINEAFRVLARKNDSSTMPPRQVFCHLLNETVCSATTQNNSFVITLFNGYSRPMKSFLVRIPYNLKEAVVYDFNKQEIPIVISPSISPGDQLQYQKLRSKYELSFIVDIPPFGFSSYFIHTIPEALPNKESPQMYSQNQNQDIFISNDLITLEFDSNSGLLKNFKDNRREISLPLSQNFYFYEGSISSGAYIFSPMGNEAILMTKKATIVNIVKNKIYQEVYQQFSPYVSQVIRLWANKTFVEFDYIVGPLPKNESCLQTHEIITRYKLDNFNSNGQFKTDANGRQLITRRRNYAADYSFDYANNITGNYYPVNSRILIEDDKNRFTILTDRSQGGSSLKDGEIELMLHRRAFNDDHLGVDENLDEPGEDERGLVIRGSHRLVIENVNETPTHRAMAFEIYHKPKIAFVSLTDENFNENMNNYHKNFNTWYSYLRTDGTTLHNLPQQLNILTLKWLSKNELLLRLEHFYQNGEDSLMSKNVEFDIEKLFGDKIKVIAKEELMLAADRYTDKNRLSKSHTKWIEKWKRQKHLRLEKNKTTDPKLSNSYTKMNKTNGDLIVTMKPMQIRTFKLKVI